MKKKFLSVLISISMILGIMPYDLADSDKVENIQVNFNPYVKTDMTKL